MHGFSKAHEHMITNGTNAKHMYSLPSGLDIFIST